MSAPELVVSVNTPTTARVIALDDPAAPSNLYFEDNSNWLYVVASPGGSTPRTFGPLLDLPIRGPGLAWDALEDVLIAYVNDTVRGNRVSRLE